jgi:HAD superfamily hydrolase (TIGR01549 family)
VSLPCGPGAVDAVLFDLDDVLAPFQTPYAWQWAWHPQGPVLGDRRVRAAIRRSLKAWDRRRWRGLTGKEPPADLTVLHEHLRATLFEVAGHPLPEPETEAVVRRLLRPAGEVESFPDVAPALERLRVAGIRWGVITPLPVESAQWLLRRVGIDPARLLVTGEGPHAPPDRAAFRAAAERLELPVDRVAYAGDLFWSDARAATRAGLASVLVDRHDVWPKVQSGRTVSLDGFEVALSAGGSPTDAENASDGPEK